MHCLLPADANARARTHTRAAFRAAARMYTHARAAAAELNAIGK